MNGDTSRAPASRARSPRTPAWGHVVAVSALSLVALLALSAIVMVVGNAAEAGDPKVSHPEVASPSRDTPRRQRPAGGEVLVPAQGRYDFAYVDWTDGPMLRLGAVKGGSTPVRFLGHGGNPNGQLAVSPAGDRIAFVTRQADGPHLRVLSLATLDDRDLGRVGANVVDPAWSPDGRWVAYVGTGRGRAAAVYRVAADGGDPILVGEVGSAMAACVAPQWSPDGAEVAFSAHGYIASRVIASGQLRTLVAPVAGRQFCEPRWSPGGDLVAYKWYAPSNSGLAKVRRDGRGAAELVALNGGFAVGQARWSPDGSRLAYVDHDAASQTAVLRVIGADGTGAAVIDRLQATVDAGHPVWSPDGALLYVRVAGETGLSLATPGHGAPRALGLRTTSIDRSSPVWFPRPLVIGADGRVARR